MQRSSLVAAIAVIWAIAPIPRLSAQVGVVDPYFTVPYITSSSAVFDLALQTDRKIIAVGFFQFTNSTYNRIVRFNPDGTLDSTFREDSSLHPTTSWQTRVRLQSDGKILWAATFNSGSSYLVRLNSDGSVDASFNPDRPNNSVRCVEVQSDGQVFIAGAFTQVGTTSRNGAARLQSNGTLDTAYNPNLDGSITASALQTDGRIVVAGTFKNVGGLSRTNIARLLTDGNPDATFNSGGGPNGWGPAATLQSDGKILIIGGFSSVNGIALQGIARLATDGTVDATFTPGYCTGGYSMALQNDGRILVGGGFSYFGSTSKTNIARLLPGGSLDSGFGVAGNVGETIYSVRMQADGNLIVGGQYTSIGGIARPGIARLFNSDPAISSHPTNQSVGLGSPATFAVLAVGTAPLSYQWWKDGVRRSGATSTSLTIPNVQSSDAGGYQAVVTNSAGSVTSTVATLTLIPPPSITTQPLSQTVVNGTNVAFTVSASGTAPLGYQWRKNGGDLGGATGSSYTIGFVQPSHAGDYTVVVTNLGGSVTSAVATLTVIGPPAITTQPASQTKVLGETVTLSVGAVGQAPLYYQWRKDGAGVGGATNNAYTMVGVQTNQAGDYTVVVSNIGGATTSAVATLTVLVPPGITVQPVSRTVVQGTNVSFSVGVSGTAPFGYQWRKNTVDISGATNASYSIGNVQPSDAADYAVYVSNTAGSILSGTATLTVIGPPGIATQPTNQTAVAGNSAGFSVVATGTAPLSYQWRKDGGDLGGATNASYTISNVTSNHAGGYRVVVSNAAGSVTSAVATLTVLVPPMITVQPADQTVVAGSVVSFNVSVTGTAPFGYQWRKNTVGIAGQTDAMLTLSSVQAGDAGNYQVMVTNAAGSALSAVAVLTVLVPPTIVTQPVSRAVALGSTASLNVSASGTAPLYYQWRKNGGDLGGATAATLTLTNVQLADGGSYQAWVTNIAGSVLSGAADLSVHLPAAIGTQPTNQSLLAGASASFSVSATGEAPLYYQWSVDGAAVSGAGGPVLVVSDVQYSGGYRVVVSNAFGVATSQSAVLTVTHLPGDEMKPPAAAVLTNLASSGPVIQPTNGAYWDGSRQKLYAGNPGTNYTLVTITWRGALGDPLTVSAFVAPWGTNVTVGLPPDQMGQAIFDFIKLKTLAASDVLRGVLKVQQSTTNQTVTSLQNQTLAGTDQALGLLEAALSQAPYVGILKSYDQQRSLSGESSAVRALVRACELLLQAAELKHQVLALRAVGGGETTPEFQQAKDLLRRVQQEATIGLLLIAQALSDSEQAAAGLPYLFNRLAALNDAFTRLLVFLPETSGEVLWSQNYAANPSTPATTELGYAQDGLNQALTSWQQAQADQRQYDTDQTALQDQLAQLGVQYLDRLVQLTGVDPRQSLYMSNGVVFGSDLVAQQYLDTVLAPAATLGDLGRQRLLLYNAATNVQMAADAERNLEYRIEIEQRKSSQVAMATTNGLARLKVIDLARSVASSYSTAVKLGYTCPNGSPAWNLSETSISYNCPPEQWQPRFGVVQDNGSYNPGAVAAGQLAGEEREIVAAQQLQVQAAESQAAIDSMRLDQAQAQAHERLSEKDYEAARLSEQQIEVEVGQLVQDYRRADTNLAGAYFNNPAYRLLRDQSGTRADRKLRSAQASAYRFARRLEYEWAERWPRGLDTSDPQWQANRDEWGAFLSGLETAFSTTNPFQLQDYLDALKEWDRQLRVHRRQEAPIQPTYGERLSFRRNLLGLEDYNTLFQLLPTDTITRNKQLFREYVAANTSGAGTAGSALELHFPLNLLSTNSQVANYFSARDSYNHKIDGFDFNLVGRNEGTNRFMSGPGTTVKLHLKQRGTAALKTVPTPQNAGNYSAVLLNPDPFADGEDPDWLRASYAIYDHVTVNSAGRLQNYQDPSTQMQNRPVAASEWVILLDNTRQFGIYLNFDLLEDVEILVSFRRNAPPTIW